MRLVIGGVKGRPLVLLFGWWKAQPAHVQKYAAIFKAEEFCTAHTTAPTWIHAGGRLVQRMYVRNVLRELLEEGAWIPGCTPVIVFCFSNGGCLLYGQLLQVLSSEQNYQEMKADLCAVLFDSCPGDLSRLLTGYNAFLASRPPLWQQIVLQGGILAGLVLALWRLAHSGVSRALTSLLPGMLGGAVPAVGLLACLLFAVQLLAKLSNALYWDNLVRLSSRTAPQLFLYSHRDPLVPSSAVEAVAARTVAAGRSVTTKVWSNSKHVDHLKHNPQEYSDTVLAFVAKAVQAHHRS